MRLWIIYVIKDEWMAICTGVTVLPPDNIDIKRKWPGEPYMGEMETKPTTQRAELSILDPKFPLDNDRDNSVTGSVTGSVNGSIDGESPLSSPTLYQESE